MLWSPGGPSESVSNPESELIESIPINVSSSKGALALPGSLTDVMLLGVWDIDLNLLKSWPASLSFAASKLRCSAEKGKWGSMDGGFFTFRRLPLVGCAEALLVTSVSTCSDAMVWQLWCSSVIIIFFMLEPNGIGHLVLSTQSLTFLTPTCSCGIALGVSGSGL